MAVKKSEEFKPFEKVLVRQDKYSKWIPAHFGYYDTDTKTYIMTSGQEYKECISYSKNKELYLVTEKQLKKKSVKVAERVPEDTIETKVNIQVPDNSSFFIRASVDMFEICIKKLTAVGGNYLFDFTRHTLEYLLKTTPHLRETDYIFYIDRNHKSIIKIINGTSVDGQQIIKTSKEIYLFY